MLTDDGRIDVMFHRFFHLLEISITLASADGQEPPVEGYVEVYNQNMSHHIKNMKITPVGEGEKVIVIRCNNWVDGFFFRLHPQGLRMRILEVDVKATKCKITCLILLGTPRN